MYWKKWFNINAHIILSIISTITIIYGVLFKMGCYPAGHIYFIIRDLTLVIAIMVLVSGMAEEKILSRGLVHLLLLMFLVIVLSLAAHSIIC
jgi:hypothetical protein